jgi:glycine cleavage system H lipoate-binding protein
MRCPFLQETDVKTCRASEFRKFIVRTLIPAGERCSSPDYKQCPVAQDHHEESAGGSQCGFLQEMLVQFCSAAPLTKFIPYSESVLSRCGSESHKYCELYLSMASPDAADPNSASALNPPDGDHTSHWVEDIGVPGWLFYSENHMWLEVDDEGCCHVGIDAFLARVLGKVQKLSFLPGKASAPPSAVITAEATDLHLVFPNRLCVTATNNYLRSHPEKLTSHPYTMGWLFEGHQPPVSPQEPAGSVFNGLFRGTDACRWMESEVHRLSEFVRDQLLPIQENGIACMTDGGIFSRDLLLHLNREQILQLFSEFFSPLSSMRRQQ